MGISARQIAEGDQWTPSDTNNLFKDIHDIEAGHALDAVDSKRVAFSSLDVLGDAGDTPPESGSYSYQDIAGHLVRPLTPSAARATAPLPAPPPAPRPARPGPGPAGRRPAPGPSA